MYCYSHLEDYINQLYRRLSIYKPEELNVADIAQKLGVKLLYSDFSLQYDNYIVLKRSIIQQRRGNTKKETKKRVEDAINSLLENNVDERVSATITFKKVTEKWLSVYEVTAGVKRGTVRLREDEIKVLNKYFENTRISSITHAIYQNMLIFTVLFEQFITRIIY